MSDPNNPRKMGKCTRCEKWAEIKITKPFCAECFILHYEKRMAKVIKHNKLIQRDDRVLMAVSGGKDSLSCAHALSKLRETFNFHLGILHMDVSLLECTNERSEAVVGEFCKVRNIPFHFVRFKDYLGVTIAQVKEKSRRNECSICATFKRYIMNRFARENGYNKLATGHCADDMTRFFFKNWFSGNYAWIAKFKPRSDSNHPKVVTRIRPVFEHLEMENLTYAKANAITICGCSRCSYFLRKDPWNDILQTIDKTRRDFKIQFARGLEEVEFSFKESSRAFFECKFCGEPTDQEICAACRLKELNKA